MLRIPSPRQPRRLLFLLMVLLSATPAAAQEVHLARLQAGEFFGEMGIVGNTPRSATVRAATPMEALSIHRSYLGPIFSYLPAWKETVREECAQRTEMNIQLERGEAEKAESAQK